MAQFLRLPAPRTPLWVGFSDPHGLPSLSSFVVPVHSNLSQSIVYEISKHQILQYWLDIKLTHTAYWEEINLSQFEQTRDWTTVLESDSGFP